MKEKKYLYDLVKSGSDATTMKFFYVILLVIGVISFFESFSIVDSIHKSNFDKELSSYADYEEVYRNYDEICETIQKNHSIDLASIPQNVKYEVFYEDGNVWIKICPILATFDAEATYIFSTENYDLLSVKKKYGTAEEYARDLKVYNFFDTIILSFVLSCVVLLILSLLFFLILACSYIRKKIDMKKQ